MNMNLHSVGNVSQPEGVVKPYFVALNTRAIFHGPSCVLKCLDPPVDLLWSVGVSAH